METVLHREGVNEFGGGVDDLSECSSGVGEGKGEFINNLDIMDPVQLQLITGVCERHPQR